MEERGGSNDLVDSLLLGAEVDELGTLPKDCSNGFGSKEKLVAEGAAAALKYSFVVASSLAGLVIG